LIKQLHLFHVFFLLHGNYQPWQEVVLQEEVCGTVNFLRGRGLHYIGGVS
jgi:hypothetical protein